MNNKQKHLDAISTPSLKSSCSIPTRVTNCQRLKSGNRGQKRVQVKQFAYPLFSAPSEVKESAFHMKKVQVDNTVPWVKCPFDGYVNY